jgi:hypothetical protein
MIDRRSQQAWWLHIDVSASIAAVARGCGYNEELGRYKFEFRGQGKKAGVQGRFGFGLFEGLTVVEVGMGKDPSQPSGQRRKVSV